MEELDCEELGADEDGAEEEGTEELICEELGLDEGLEEEGTEEDGFEEGSSDEDISEEEISEEIICCEEEGNDEDTGRELSDFSQAARQSKKTDSKTAVKRFILSLLAHNYITKHFLYMRHPVITNRIGNIRLCFFNYKHKIFRRQACFCNFVKKRNTKL